MALIWCSRFAYEKMAKRVDVKQLQSTIWTDLTSVRFTACCLVPNHLPIQAGSSKGAGERMTSTKSFADVVARLLHIASLEFHH